MKNLLVLLVMLFTVSSSMAKEVEVFGDFKSYIKQLKAYPLTSDKSSTSVSYLRGNDFNLNILTKYGSNVQIHDDYISVWSTIDGYGPQCVSFVQHVSNAGYTGNWYKGNAISALTPKFSVVAVFNQDTWRGEKTGYSNTDGKSHTGIYVNQNDKGIYLLEQNFTGTGTNPVGKISVRLIPWDSGNKKYPQTSAKNYFVVETD